MFTCGLHVLLVPFLRAHAPDFSSPLLKVEVATNEDDNESDTANNDSGNGASAEGSGIAAIGGLDYRLGHFFGFDR